VTLNADLIVNFMIAVLVIFILWLVLTNVPPLAGYRNWINIGCLILVVLALIAVMRGSRAINIGGLEPDSHDLRTVARVALHEHPPLRSHLLL
jgi:hypothetical protein